MPIRVWKKPLKILPYAFYGKSKNLDAVSLRPYYYERELVWRNTMDRIKFAESDAVIDVERAALQGDGQELMEFVREVWESAARFAPDFGARPGHVMIRAIFRDQVIVRDEGNRRFVKLKMARGKKGQLLLKAPRLVRQEWVEAGEVPLERSEETEAKGSDSEFAAVAVTRNREIWGQVVGFAI